MSRSSSRIATSNRPHIALGVALAAGLAVAAVLPVASQDAVFGEPMETDFAPYALGRAGEDISRASETPPDIPADVARTDTVTFSVGGLVENYGQAEYKVTMKPGAQLHYSWTASDDIYYEFHGHLMVDPETPGDALLYRDEQGSQSHGVITAPIEGWHGWYFVNDSFDTPIEIELTLAGDYELTPGVINTRR